MCNYDKLSKICQNISVLYVEDDAAVLKENSIIFKNFFTTMITAKDGIEGLEKYNQYKNDIGEFFDLIISDINMPNLDGISMIKQIKEINTTQEVIVMSAYSDSDKLIKLIQLGISNFLIKPLKLNIFLETTYKICENISNKKELCLTYDIINLSKDHSSFIDKNYIYRQVNNAYLEAHNKKRDDIIGLSVATLMGEDIFNNIIKDKLDDCLNGNEVHYKDWFDFKGIGKRYMDVYYYPHKIKNGIVIGVVITSHDITELINAQQELQRKDKLFYEQSKIASLGELIENIAHQWRQPLSVISTAASGLIIEQEFGTLTDKRTKETCQIINSKAQYLSKTIEEFRDYLTGDIKEIEFNLVKNNKRFLQLIEAAIEENNISIVLDLQDDISITGYPNRLIECFINIFNNSKDALILNNNKDDRYIFISQKIIDDNIVIKFKDNAGGIKQKNLSKIFEPYFTTKHQAQGVGLSLNKTYNIIKNLGGTIEVENIDFLYDDKSYTGAEFTINISLNKEALIQ